MKFYNSNSTKEYFKDSIWEINQKNTKINKIKSLLIKCTHQNRESINAKIFSF